MEDGTIETEPLLPIQVDSPESNQVKSKQETTSNTRTFIVAAFILLVGLTIWTTPPFHNVAESSMHILSVFTCVIFSMMLTEYPLAFILGWGVLILTLSNSLICHGEPCSSIHASFDISLKGFSQDLSWLVLLACHLSLAIEKSGLGDRMACYIVGVCGSSLIGLGYSIFLSELVMGPFVPSNSARGGSFTLPIVKGLLDSLADPHQPTPNNQDKITKYLFLCASNANLIISSTFLTGTIGNPLISKLASSTFGIEFNFTTWFIGAVVPSTILSLLLPLVLHLIYSPEYSHVLKREDIKYEKLSRKESLTILIMVICLMGWIFGRYFEIPETLIAFLGLYLLLSCSVLEWADILKNYKGWDAYFWLSLMMLMANQISESGLADSFGSILANWIIHLQLNPIPGCILLATLYFFSMYFFSGITAHVVVFAHPFFQTAKALGYPSYLIVGLIAYFSSLSAVLTSYSTGTQAMYFSLSSLTRREFFVMGLLSGLLTLLVYYSIGLFWWHKLGWI